MSQRHDRMTHLLAPALGWASVGRTGRRRRRVAIATGVTAGVTAVGAYAAVRATRARPRGEAPGRSALNASVTINRRRRDVYKYLSDFQKLPDFMDHLESVTVTADDRLRWRARGPGNKIIEWDAEIVEERPGELIAWRALHGGAMGGGGAVHLADAPGGRGTEVRVELAYELPGGKAGRAFARMVGEHPEQRARDDLRRLKQILETGEVIRSEGSPEGTHARRQLRQRAAQPAIH